MPDAAADSTRIELRVQRNLVPPRRLDQYVTSRIPDLSRADVQRLILSGALLLNGGRTKASYKLKLGDHIVIDVPDRLTGKPEPQYIPLDILYEDEFIVVLNKQANLIVHPGRGRENWDGTLTNALQYHFDHLSTIGGACRPGIVHRLDRNTTGVLVVAKDDLAHKNLGLQFERRQVRKEYLALCYGAPDRDSDYIERSIGPHPTTREKMAIRENCSSSRSARTFYEVQERFAGFSFVRLQPHTGRTHQLRVHLEHIGVPMIADHAYSGRHVLKLSDLCEGLDKEQDALLIDRQALHAHRLCFRHPRCHEEMEVVAPVPEDFERTLAALREHRRLGGASGGRRGDAETRGRGDKRGTGA